MHASRPRNRRAHLRFQLPAMYTTVKARRAGEAARGLSGHIYDISQSGARIELDEPLEPGELIAVLLGLPGAGHDVCARGRIVWVNDQEDDPGPRRMAVQFTGFANQADRERLVRYLESGQLRRAA